MLGDHLRATAGKAREFAEPFDGGEWAIEGISI